MRPSNNALPYIEVVLERHSMILVSIAIVLAIIFLPEFASIIGSRIANKGDN